MNHNQSLISLSQEILNASENGFFEVVQSLLDNGADPNQTDDTIVCQSPLILASHQGHIKIVKLLLDAGANIEYQNSQGENALITAAQEGQTDVVRLLLLYGADTTRTNTNGETAYMLASTLLRGEVKTVMGWLLRTHAE